MNKTRIRVSLIAILSFLGAQGQTIQMSFPHFAGKTYDLILFQGDQQKKIIQDTIPKDGKFTLAIPKEYAPYTGMSRWLITGTQEGGGIDMVIPGKDFSISCPEKQPNENNIIYQGNDQVKELTTLYKKQQTLLSRRDVMLLAVQSFPEKNKNYKIFQQEYKNQLEGYKSFQKELMTAPDYAKKLMKIVNITQGIGTELSDSEEKKAENIANVLAQEIDWQAVYTSGHWTSVISSWVDIHTQVIKDPYRFVNDFVTISKKLDDEKLYTDFVGRTSYYLTQQGKDTYISAIAPLVVASGKIKKYEGSLAAFIKGAVGTQAPDLIFIEHEGKISDHKHKTTTLKSNELTKEEDAKTLLVFYKSDCGPYANLLQQLPGNYQNIKAKEIRIISISADEDETAYRDKSKDFLWKDSFCDYEGVKGVNFKNYGVAGTPTMILIDKKGKILLRTAGLAEILDFIK